MFDHLNIKRRNGSYSIKKLTNDINIIDKFNEKDDVFVLLIKLKIYQNKYKWKILI